MRLLSIFFIVIIFSCNSTKKVTDSDLNGNWKPVKQEISGMVLPPASFKDQKLSISNGGYTFVAESVDKGIIKRIKNRMDIYGKEGVNAGKHFTAIYKMENNQLIICYNLAGDKYPEAFDTKDNKQYFLCVFEKE